MNLLPISWLTLGKILGIFGQRQNRLDVYLEGSPAAMLSTSGLSRCASPLLTWPLALRLRCSGFGGSADRGPCCLHFSCPWTSQVTRIWQYCARAM